MIASVAFRNFKALRKTSLRLEPFNLVIGPNGSGKTSLIQAILRLRTLAKLPLAEKPPRGMNPSGPEILFRFAPPCETVEAKLSCVSELVCDFLQVETASPEGWERVKMEVARVRNFLFDPCAMAAPAPRSQGSVLASNGGNLAAVLAERRERAPEAFALLESEMVRLFPEFERIVLSDSPGGAVSLGLKLGDGGPPVAGENLSEGTLYILAALALAHDPEPPSIVCVEEIDRGIHPRMLREVRDLLYRLSYPAAFGEKRAPVQVIATTQSPFMLDLFREHPEEIVITQKSGRESRFERLGDRPDLGELLREGSLGDLWYSGILGGVPDEGNAGPSS